MDTVIISIVAGTFLQIPITINVICFSRNSFPTILKAHCYPTLREFRVVGNCHLGNNTQSEHCIQQMNPAKIKGQSPKAAWVNMAL